MLLNKTTSITEQLNNKAGIPQALRNGGFALIYYHDDTRASLLLRDTLQMLEGCTGLYIVGSDIADFLRLREICSVAARLDGSSQLPSPAEGGDFSALLQLHAVVACSVAYSATDNKIRETVDCLRDNSCDSITAFLVAVTSAVEASTQPSTFSRFCTCIGQAIQGASVYSAHLQTIVMIIKSLFK